MLIDDSDGEGGLDLLAGYIILFQSFSRNKKAGS